MGYGLICPRDNAKMLFKELDDLNTKGIKQDLAENGKENIIDCMKYLEHEGLITDERKAKFNFTVDPLYEFVLAW